MREFLQNYGTEAHRDIFGDDFWVDQVLPLHLNHEGQLLIVTDARFPNEIERIKKLNGYIWRVSRDEETTLYGGHLSEQDIDESMIDLVIDNTGDLPRLRKEVYRAFRFIEKKELK